VTHVKAMRRQRSEHRCVRIVAFGFRHAERRRRRLRFAACHRDVDVAQRDVRQRMPGERVIDEASVPPVATMFENMTLRSTPGVGVF
jgi:hypothetical protein